MVEFSGYNNVSYLFYEGLAIHERIFGPTFFNAMLRAFIMAL